MKANTPHLISGCTSDNVSIVEIRDGKVKSTWLAPDLTSAINDVKSLKITGPGGTFSIESKSGTVLEVIKL